jgi:uncharacterized protein YciI
MKEFLYKLNLPERLQDESGWTETDSHAVAAHFAYLQKALEDGKLIIAGRTDEPYDKTIGIAVFYAHDEKDAEDFMKNDPAVKLGVMNASLHPFRLALLKN